MNLGDSVARTLHTVAGKRGLLAPGNLEAIPPDKHTGIYVSMQVRKSKQVLAFKCLMPGSERVASGEGGKNNKQ